MTRLLAWSLVLVILLALPLIAQQRPPATTVVVPRLIRFAGTVRDVAGKPMSGTAGITFALYKDQEGGAALWLETQNVPLDASGHYNVLLGATKEAGVPMELFTSGEAQWLGVRVEGQAEQPRILLVSVPYALKAADADTVGGLPPSAFALAATAASTARSTADSAAPAESVVPATGTAVTTPGGVVNKLAKFDGTSDITSAQVFDNGTNVAIGNTSPAAKLDVSGGGIFRGVLQLPATGVASSVNTAGFASQPFDLAASDWNSSAKVAVAQRFRWQATQLSSNTASPSATLNLLFASGTGTPAQTGLKISSKGIVTFASGQKFPGTGTVTSVGLGAPGEFTVSGSPVTGSGTLGLSWVTAPTSAATPNAIVERDVTGSFTATSISASTPAGTALSGTTTDTSTGTYGVHGNGPNYGVYGDGPQVGVAGNSSFLGVLGAGAQYGVRGVSDNGTAVHGITEFGWAGYFEGDVNVTGAIFAGTKDFKIDHPLDPAHKYLLHASVESSEMMNIYTGNVTTDAHGEATVQLPTWFEALNRDFRYQLTAIGAPGPTLYIAEKVHTGSFKIAGAQPGMEVSWQITGVRHDSYATAHPLQVEVSKVQADKGVDLRRDAVARQK